MAGGTKGVPKKWSEEKLHKLGQSLVDHCDGEDVFHIADWTGKVQNRTQAWWYKLKESYPMLVEYHLKAKEKLGNKIVAQAFKAGNTWAVKTFVPKYLDDVKKHLHEEMRVEAKIKAEAAKSAMINDTEHPFWKLLDKYMDEDDKKPSQS